MKLINFELHDPPHAISLIAGDKLWDLHNSLEFAGLIYFVHDNSLILRWNGTDVQMLSGSGIELTFINITKLTVTERDSELPLSEDTCLSAACKVSTENHKSPESRVQQTWLKDEPFHLLFQFQSGRFIEIGAASVELSIPTLQRDYLRPVLE